MSLRPLLAVALWFSSIKKIGQNLKSDSMEYLYSASKNYLMIRSHSKTVNPDNQFQSGQICSNMIDSLTFKDLPWNRFPRSPYLAELVPINLVYGIHSGHSYYENC